MGVYLQVWSLDIFSSKSDIELFFATVVMALPGLEKFTRYESPYEPGDCSLFGKGEVNKGESRFHIDIDLHVFWKHHLTSLL